MGLALMDPFGKDVRPNYWRPCMTCESNIQFAETRSERQYTYEEQHGTAAPMEIYDALRAFHAEACPVYKPMSMQPVFRGYDQITVDGSRIKIGISFSILNQRRTEAQCIDDLFAVDLGLVHILRVFFGKENMEIPILIDQQQILARGHGFLIHNALAQYKALGIPEVIISAESHHGIDPVGHDLDIAHAPDLVKSLHGHGAQLGRIGNFHPQRIQPGFLAVRQDRPVVSPGHMNGRILVFHQADLIIPLGLGAAGKIHGQLQDFSTGTA